MPKYFILVFGKAERNSQTPFLAQSKLIGSKEIYNLWVELCENLKLISKEPSRNKKIVVMKVLGAKKLASDGNWWLSGKKFPLQPQPFEGMCCANLRNVIWKLFEDPNSSKAAKVRNCNIVQIKKEKVFWCWVGGDNDVSIINRDADFFPFVKVSVILVDNCWSTVWTFKTSFLLRWWWWCRLSFSC